MKPEEKPLRKHVDILNFQFTSTSPPPSTFCHFSLSCRLFLDTILQFDLYFCFLTMLLLFSSSFPPVFLLLRDKAPGQRECDSSIDNINKCIRDIEQASLAAVSQNLPSRDDISLEVKAHQHIFHRRPPLWGRLCMCLSSSACLSLRHNSGFFFVLVCFCYLAVIFNLFEFSSCFCCSCLFNWNINKTTCKELCQF